MFLFALSLSLGCARGDFVFIDTPWSAGQTAIIVVARPDNTPIAGPTVEHGPVDLRVEEEPPFRVHSRVFETGVIGGDCRIAIGGEGFELPEASAAFVGEVRPGDEVAVLEPTFTPVEFDLVSTCPLTVNCPTARIASTTVELPGGRPIGAIVALSAGRVMVGSDARRGGAPTIVRVEDEQQSLLDTSTVTGSLVSLEIEGGVVYGATRDGAFRYTDDSRAFVFEKTPTAIDGVEPVPMGLPIAFGDAGIREVLGAGTSSTPIESFASRVRSIEIVSPSLGVLIDEANLLYVFDGAGWANATPLGLQIESFRRVAGDGTTFLAVGRRENALFREADAWRSLPPPFDRGLDFHDVVHLGGRRYLAVADRGSAALWDGSSWCSFDLGTTHSLNRASAIGDRTIFIAADTGTDAVPFFFELTLE